MNTLKIVLLDVATVHVQKSWNSERLNQEYVCQDALCLFGFPLVSSF